eukprot:7986297-Pyramimonas_sp.AAC.1
MGTARSRFATDNHLRQQQNNMNDDTRGRLSGQASEETRLPSTPAPELMRTLRLASPRWDQPHEGA